MLGAVEGGMAAMNGSAGARGGEDYQQWMEGKVAQAKAPPQTQRHAGEVYSNTLPVRKAAPAKSKTTLSEDTHTCSCFASQQTPRGAFQRVLVRDNLSTLMRNGPQRRRETDNEKDPELK